MERMILNSADGITRTERWTCQSASERDAQLRIFPWPIPSTHEVFYRWTDDMHYEVGLRAKTVPVVTQGTTTTELPPPPAPATTTGATTHPLDKDTAELAKTKRDDLKTIAAENNIDLAGFLATNKQASNLQAADFVKKAWEAKKK